MAKQKLEVEIGANTKEFDSKLKGASKGVDSFGKELAAIAGAAAAAAGAIAIMTDWFKKTEAGADFMNSTLRVSKDLLSNLMLGQRLQLKESLSIAEAENKIRAGNRTDLIKEAILNRDIRKYRLEAYDDTKSIQERLDAQTKALEKQRELEKYRKDDLKEELEVVQRGLAINPIDTGLLNKQAELIAAIFNADESESLRMVSYLNTLKKQMQDRANSLVDAFTDIKEIVEEIDGTGVNKVSTGSPNIQIEGLAERGGLTGGPKSVNHVEDLTKALQVQQEAVGILSSGFRELFTSTGNGFADMVESIGNSLKSLAAEILAKSAIFALMAILFPGTSFGAMGLTGLRNMFGANAFSGGGKVLSGAGGGGVSKPLDVVGNIKGRDISLSLKRS